MIKFIFILVFLSHYIGAQVTRNDKPIPAFGNSIQYSYKLDYLRNRIDDEELLLSEFFHQTLKYTYVRHGQKDFRLSQIIDGKQVHIFKFKDGVESTALIEVKKVDNDTIFVLLLDNQGYQLYWLTNKNKTWEKKMMAFFYNFLPSDGNRLSRNDIKKVTITESGGLLLSYNIPNRVDDSFSFTFGKPNVKLNESFQLFDDIGHLYWFKDGKRFRNP